MTRRERLLELLKKQPDDVFLHYGLAMEMVKQGQVSKALPVFDKVLSLDASYLAAYFQKATALVAAERVAEARAVLTSGIASARSKGDHHTESEMQGFLDSLG